jgi:hypothetical protein
MTPHSLAHPAHDPAPAKQRAQAIKERTTRGLLLYNRERERIHVLYGDVWAVPSSQGGFWRVNLADETCGCRDFRYACTDRDTGEPFMNCKHVTAAAIARAKQAAAAGHLCYDGWVYMTYLAPDEPGGDEVEQTYRVPCRRCQG